MKEVVFSNQTVDFVRIAIEYCAFVEKAGESKKSVFVDTTGKILPLLYLKVSVIPEIEELYDADFKPKVTEAMYAAVEKAIEELLGEDNLYLETFHSDMRLSDSPIAVRISENLADIYQDLGNFIAVFKDGNKETMNDSLAECIQHFKEYWGQKLVNVLRAIHYLKYQND